jgi:hypothetical protein
MRLAIGDIHGKPFWEHYLDEDFTEYYILGDYFDSYGLSFKEEYANFQRLRDAALLDPRLKLCLGNHDYHYLKGIPPNERYSRYESDHHIAIREVLEDSMDSLSVVYTTPDHYLLSHAGVSCTYMHRAKDKGFATPESLNEAFKQDIRLFAFYGYNIYGDDPGQGPFWIRPNSLAQDALPGYTHIVGHTPQSAGITESLASDGVTRCVFIDTGNSESVYRF